MQITNTSKKHFLFTEKYRPHTVEDCILPSDLKKTFQGFVRAGNIPTLLLIGPPGFGKTTVAKAMLDELDCEYIVINGSLNGNIDNLRNEISSFASSVSFKGGRKYVLIDEADYLNAQSFQPAFRNFMEEFAANCGFILTGNYQNKIIKEIQSRCSIVYFTIPASERREIAIQFMKRVCKILDEEKITYTKPVIAAIIEKFFPDFRRVLNELQRYSHSGTIDVGILGGGKDLSLLYGSMKEKDFTAVRKWVAENSDNDPDNLFREFYDNAINQFKTSYIPQLVLTIAKYQFWGQNCVDPEINLAAFLAEVMIESEWIG